MNSGTDDRAANAPEPRPQTWYQRGFAQLTGIDKNFAHRSALRLTAPGAVSAREKFTGLGWALLACVLATALSLSLRSLLAPANLVLIYLMAVVLVAMRFGSRPGVLASILAVLAFDFFLVPPYYSLTVADPQYLLTFAIMLMVALIISHLAAHLRQQELLAHDSELSMASERLRNSLLSAISHDIRTPLTAIVGFSSTLASGRALSEQTRQELAEAIEEDALRMNSLVTNLLDMARLQAGGVQLNLQWQMLEEVVGSALAMLSRPLAGHGIELALPMTLPLLNFDAVLMERVFCNLLDNAAKYAPRGSIVRISAATAGDTVRVSVEDSGPGFRAGMERSIFDKFTRGEVESSQSGVGLGLSICRTIIEAHGGHIRAENRVEGGARFVFTLPLGHPPADSMPDMADPDDLEPAP